MKLKLDGDVFDEYQAIFIGEIIEVIKSKLEKSGIKGDALKELTGDIAFSIATTVDNSAGIEFDGVEVNPYLMFELDDNELLHCGGNSYTHEYVFGVLDEIFGED